MDVIGMASWAEWDKVVNRSCFHDIYHLSSYHALAEYNGEGSPYLFIEQDGEHFIALPLLLRSLEALPFVSKASCGWLDATSVYGYAGPISSVPAPPAELVAKFQRELHAQLSSMCVISAFSRLHPLMFQHPILTDLGSTVHRGQTVSIDLGISLDEQSSSFRSTFRRHIRDARRNGLTIHEDKSGEYFSAFATIYLQTMQRVRASKYYHFSDEYFNALREFLGHAARLFVVLHNNTVVAGALILVENGTVQYHLGGSTQEYFHLSPMKLLIDEIRIWATEQKFRRFHLGGGVGGNADSLFYFKTGFSDIRHEFSTWRWIVNPARYRAALACRSDWLSRNALTNSVADYFPGYRCPTTPSACAIFNED